MTDRLNLVLIFGGRSGEHAVSLNSAQSVLNALDESKYRIFQVGITTDGLWLYGPDAHQAFREGNFGSLSEALVLNDSGKPYLYTRTGNQLERITPIDVAFPVLHALSARMEPFRVCSKSKIVLMLARVCLAPPWQWTRQSANT